MKYRTPLPVIAIAVPLMLLSMAACTVNPNASATENAANFINQPSTQAELTVLNQIGTTALNNWVSSQVTKGRHENKEQFIATQTNRAAKQHPNIPREKISAAIRAKLADK